MPTTPTPPSDLEILEALWGPVLKIKPNLAPKMGTGEFVYENDFLGIYRRDPLYGPTALGFNSKAMYKAHQSLTRLTSLYRNVGTGTEAVVKLLIERCLGITPEQHRWQYHYTFNGSPRTRTLDGAIRFEQIKNAKLRRRVRDWVRRHDPQATGLVLEVREGYKSSDAKRSNGDKDAVLAARADNLVPVMLVLSDQIAATTVATYTKCGWNIEAGAQAYQFCAHVFGVDLLAVMERNPKFMNRVRRHVRKLI
jgi:hypothetical protein